MCSWMCVLCMFVCMCMYVYVGVWEARGRGKGYNVSFSMYYDNLLNVSFSLFQTNQGELLDVLFKGDEFFFLF